MRKKILLCLNEIINILLYFFFFLKMPNIVYIPVLTVLPI